MTESDHDMAVLNLLARLLQSRMSEMDEMQREENATRIRDAKIVLRRYELRTLGAGRGHSPQ